MFGNARILFEGTAFEGQDPFVLVDTDLLSPPTYEDVVEDATLHVRVGPDADDQAVAIPDCCYLLVVSDIDVVLRLDDGETAMTTRHFVVGGGASPTIAISARDLLFTGDTANTANVQITYLTAT